jgi:hypothetical protein
MMKIGKKGNEILPKNEKEGKERVRDRNRCISESVSSSPLRFGPKSKLQFLPPRSSKLAESGGEALKARARK